MGEQIVPLFRNVLLICDELKLIGGDMFAIDGCKLPSDASKSWSGTKAELKKKQRKLEKAARAMLKRLIPVYVRQVRSCIPMEERTSWVVMWP